MKNAIELNRRALLIGGAAFTVSACASSSAKRPLGRNHSATNQGIGMTITLYQCFIAVHDHDQALGFYRDAIGLDVRNDVKYGGMRWTTLGAKAQPDVSIVLEPPLADPSASEADRTLMAEVLAKGLLRGVIFGTDNCDATFERIRASGAKVLQEPTDQHYGVRDCAFRDPSGNMIRFSQKR